MFSQSARGYSVKKLQQRISNGNIFEGYNYKTKAVVEVVITNDFPQKIPLKLNHKSLVKYLDTFEHGRRYWTIRERVIGIQFAHYVENLPTEQDKLRVIVDILEGLAFLHAQGHTHGRLTVDNIIISKEDAHIKLTNYGTPFNSTYETSVRDDIVNFGRICLRITQQNSENLLVSEPKASLVPPFGSQATLQSFIQECLHPTSNTTTELLLSHPVIRNSATLQTTSSKRVIFRKDSTEPHPLHHSLTFDFEDLSQTKLHVASEQGDVEQLVQLLNEGADAFAVNRDGLTPLLIAAQCKYRDIVDILLEVYKEHKDVPKSSSKHIDFTDPDGKTSLHYACMYGMGEIAVLLLDEGAFLDAPDKEGKTPLHYATIYGYQDIVELLVEDGANKEAVDTYGNTPMMSGLIEGVFGAEECVRMLIEYDANINHLNQLKQTPLYAAIHQQSKSIAHLLLEEGADYTYRNPSDNSSLLHTVCAVGLSNIVGKMLSHIDINDRNAQDMTPLLYMIHNFRALKTPNEAVVSIFRLLISTGADLSLCDINGNTVLHLLAKQNLRDLLELLSTDYIDQLLFVDLDQQNAEGMSCLEISFANMETANKNSDTDTFETCREMVKQLVDIGANINRKDEEGKTLLHRAILSEKEINTVKLLSELIAHPFLPDDTGRTAIHYAVKAPPETTGFFFGSRAVQEVIKVWWSGHRRQLFLSFFIFALSLAIYTTVCIYQTSRNRLSSAHLSLSVESTLLNSAPNDVGNTFIELLTRDDFYTWGSEILIPTLYSHEGLSEYNWVLDGSRMIQYRVQTGNPKECVIPSELQDRNITCYVPYDSDTETEAPYSSFESSELHTKVISGSFANYGSRGYVIYFFNNTDDNFALWKDISTNWIDDYTRAVAIQFFLFNPYYNLFTSVQLLVEFPPIGSVVTNAEIQTARLFPYETPVDYFILFLELLLVVYLIVYIVDEILELMNLHYLSKKRIIRVYFGDIWNVIDLLIISVITSVFIIRCYRVFLVYQLIDWNNIQDQYSHLFNAFMAHDAEVDFMALGMLFFWLKLLRFSPMVYPRMGLFISMIKFMIFNLGNFFFILTICIFGCTLATHILFGNQITSFSTIGPAMVAIINYLAGNSAQELLSTSSFMGPLMYIILLSVILIVLLNLLIAVLNSSYAEVEKEATTAWTREQAEILVDNLDKLNKFALFSGNRVKSVLKEPKGLLDTIQIIVDKYVSYRKYYQNAPPADSSQKLTIGSQMEQIENTLQFVKSSFEKRLVKQNNYMEEKFEILLSQTSGTATAASLTSIEERIKKIEVDLRKIRIISMMRGAPVPATTTTTTKSKWNAPLRTTPPVKTEVPKPNTHSGEELKNTVEESKRTEEERKNTTAEPKITVEEPKVEYNTENTQQQQVFQDVLAMLEEEEKPKKPQRKKKLRGPGAFMEATASSKARLELNKRP